VAIDTAKLLQKPTKEEITKMPFDEMQARKAFAYQAAVANGTNAERLLSGLYKDPTHFIYELLQNAEDTRATEVKITLEAERLVFEHNGRHFNNRDVWAVLSIDESTKNENEDDLTQIGRFGIGFKAVFGICEAPEIYSRDFSFRIRNFYVPEKITRPSDQNPNRTYIVLPFKVDATKDIFDTIDEALLTLGPDTILFLRNISKLDYITPEHSGFFDKKKNTKKRDGHEYYECDILGRQGVVAKYYLFERPLKRDKRLIASIAYRVDEEKKQIVAAAESTKLVVFFPTETNTFLRFKVNGPYQTTPTRESVPETADNLEILHETAELYAESLHCIKALKMLTVDFLQMLPLKSRKTAYSRWTNGKLETYYKVDNVFYETMYDATVVALSTEEFLPKWDGTYTTADKAILARGGATDTRGESIVDLLSAEDIAAVFENRTTWLSTDITLNKTPDLRTLLISVLKIKEVDFDDFLVAVKGEFLETKDNEWLIRFYTIGNRNISTIRGKHLGKEIIKTESGKMVATQVNKKANVYLASKLTTDADRIVNRELSNNDEVMSFCHDIGIAEMGVVESIRTQWIPSIAASKDEAENLDNLELLYLEYCDQKADIQIELRDLLRESDCILFISKDDNGESEICFDKPSAFFMAHGTSMTLYEGNPRVRFINDKLNSKAERDKGFYDFLRAIGVKAGAGLLQTNEHLPWDDAERQRITKHANASYGKYNFESWQIFEIKYILANMTKERSRVLWQFVSNIPEEWFKGTLSWWTRNTPHEEPFTSYFVRALQDGKWLYKVGSDEPVTPREIFQDDAEKEYGRAPVITKHLSFMPDDAKRLPPDDYDLLMLAKKIKASGGEEELRKLAELCAAIPETPKIIDADPEGTPATIETADFSNPYKGKTSDELAEAEDSPEVAGMLTDPLEELYANADIPETVKEYIAMKRMTDEAETDGDLGERAVLSSIKEEYRQAGYTITNDSTSGFSATKHGRTIDVLRNNTVVKNQRGFDISKVERGVVFEWIEVKAKKDDSPKLFKVSGLQWTFAKKKHEEGDGDKFFVYVVTFVQDKEKRKITKTPNPYKAWLDGDLKANPVRLEY